MSITRRLAVLFLLPLLFCLPVFAQGGATGAIGSGVVQDTSGAVIAGAKVSMLSEADRRDPSPAEHRLLRAASQPPSCPSALTPWK